MNIDNSELIAQVERARVKWPFIHDVEVAWHLPAWLLYAVGSRETNLANEIGDYGHGFGVWQRDNRSFQVDANYLKNVHQEAIDAAQELAAGIRALGLAGGVAAYNCGQGNVRAAIRKGKSCDAYTTGHDYSADVLARCKVLADHYAPKPAPPAQHIYIVRAGDTLSGIAATHHTTVAVLVKLNHITNPDRILIGQRLVLP